MKWCTNISACDITSAAVSLVGTESLPGRTALVSGRGQLAVTRSGDRSVVSRAYATSPLKLLTPANHGTAAWVYTATYGGGLVDGDAIALEIEVGHGAAAFVSTQASTKVYRSPHGTSAELRARIGRDGLLVVAPDPLVCFAASRYRQAQHFDLADGARLVLLDWISSGRRAAGERWAFDECVGQLVIRSNGKLMLHDALALRAADGDLTSRLGRFEVLAIVLVLGRPLRAAAARLVSTVREMAIVRRPDQLVAATALADAGCVLRVAGVSVEDVGRTIRDFLGFVPALLGDDPWKRKW